MRHARLPDRHPRFRRLRSMASLEEWLGPALFKAAGSYLQDELGAEEPADLRDLADGLGLSTFGVLGFSSGGPYSHGASALPGA